MSTLARRPVLLVAGAIAALLLAGCSSGSETAESTGEAPNASTVQTLPTSAPAPSQGAEQGEDGEAAEGGEEEGEGTEGEEGGAVAAPSGAGATQSYTLADVSGHATAEDCWSAIDGGVFDLTSWIPQHPGGSEVIVAMCGIDGSASYSSVHAGQGEPAQVLAQLQVGVLAG